MNKKAGHVIAYILKGYPRISETFIANEILLLEQLGFTIYIFPMRQPRENFSHETVKKIRAEIHYLPTNLLPDLRQWLVPNLLLAITHPIRYGIAASIACRRFARTRNAATFKHLFQAGFMVYKHLLKIPLISHLHGHFAHSPTSVTYFASILSEIPFSFTAHAKDIYTSNREQLREKIAKASFVVTCTRYNAKYLQEIAGTIDTPVHCIYHGIDTRFFAAAGAEIHCHPPYKLLTVARITAKKGLPTLYQALSKIKKRGVEFRHTLIGDGDDRETILTLIKTLGLEMNCHWLGTRTHEEVLHHFKESDLFVLACEIAEDGDRDGIPNVLVESLAMGVPAISTDVSAIPELIIDETTGLTVPPSDSDKMAEGIVLLLTDPDLRRKVIEQGREFVHKNFDNRQLTANLGQIFRDRIDRAITQ